MSRLQNLKTRMNKMNVQVSTWSPGDGITRFRFHADMDENYFGANQVMQTALGIKEAELVGYSIASGIHFTQGRYKS